MIVYTITGLLCGWAGVLLFAHGSSGNPTAAQGDELLVMREEDLFAVVEK